MTSKIYHNIHHDDGKNTSTRKTYRRKVKQVKFVERKTSRLPSLRDIDGR